MMEINLLPWRQTLYSKRKKQKILLISLVFSFLFLILLSGNFYIYRLKKQFIASVEDLNSIANPSQSNSESISAYDKENILGNYLHNQKSILCFLNKINQAARYKIQFKTISFLIGQREVIGYASSLGDVLAWINIFRIDPTTVKTIETKPIPAANLTYFRLSY